MVYNGENRNVQGQDENRVKLLWSPLAASAAVALEKRREMEKGVPSAQRDSIPRSLAAAPLVLPSHL